ncbi:MAG: DM13 domain-containing protein [Actinomycetota bacterium]
MDKTEDARREPVKASPAARLGAGVTIAIVLIAGVFVLGRLAATDRAALLFTAVWFLAVLIGGIVIARSRPALLGPMTVAYTLVAAGALILLGAPMVGNREVDEEVVTAATAGNGDAAGNILIASGGFVPLSHPGSGTAAVIEVDTGERKLTLTDFETDNGPDLRVYLTAGDPADGGDIGDFVDLGALKGNVGNQQYDIPSDVDVERFPFAVVWCRAFSVGFTSAALES